jgi:hypothetical protein
MQNPTTPTLPVASSRPATSARAGVPVGDLARVLVQPEHVVDEHHRGERPVAVRHRQIAVDFAVRHRNPDVHGSRR